MNKPVYLSSFKKNTQNVLTVGTFDGVHLGHQALLQNVVNRAREKKAPAIVVTFDPHPREVISPSEKGIRLLTTLGERSAFLHDFGIDKVVAIPFTRDFSILSSEEFIREFIHKRIGVDTFVIGYDHHFGRDRKGSIQTLQRLSKELGFTVYVEKAHEVSHTTVSSTAIRKLLEETGDVSSASKLLGRYYEVGGTIVKGDQRGRTIGYPTANIQPEHPRKVIPAIGVYCIDAELEGGFYKGMMNIGRRPTFTGDKNDENIVLEAHLFDFNRDVYGRNIRIKFKKRLRGEMKFHNSQALMDQLSRDHKDCE